MAVVQEHLDHGNGHQRYNIIMAIIAIEAHLWTGEDPLVTNTITAPIHRGVARRGIHRGVAVARRGVDEVGAGLLAPFPVRAPDHPVEAAREAKAHVLSHELATQKARTVK
jgi:hypothetical protein